MLAGLTYTFQLIVVNGIASSSSAVLESNVVARAAVTIGGAVIVQPTSGNALQTLFEVSTSLWTDDPSDFPLQYAFYYFQISPERRSML